MSRPMLRPELESEPVFPTTESEIEDKIVILTQEEYMQKTHNDSSVYHFYEKLLRLRHMMKTETGRKMAQHRHEFMVTFLKQFFLEYQGIV
mmetsp:Transcript_17419/g.44358  ORF Transcript_17419/g.44358 Transcript_17419/m.44358 type:complete len:91 (+) Transcript_17419:591-863(+)